jgi:hypothetical protein
MRRPLNWLVVCLSLLFLLANLSFDRNRGMNGQSATPVLAGSVYADDLSSIGTLIGNEPQFGYVRTDGSFLPLAKQDVEPGAAEVGSAVYVWSSPASASSVPESF